MRGPSSSKGASDVPFRHPDAPLIFGDFSAEIHLCQRVACLLFAVFNHMTVDIFRRGNLRVVQHFRHGDHIRSLRNQYRGRRMAESVRVDMRQAFLLAKLSQPLRAGIRSVRSS